MKLYYNISEVAEQMGVNASHLRFLESQFSELRPHTDRRGVRQYTQDDVELIRRIIYLTKECGYTLDGARQQMRTARRQQAAGIQDPMEEKVQIVDNLKQIRQFLVDLKDQL